MNTRKSSNTAACVWCGLCATLVYTWDPCDMGERLIILSKPVHCTKVQPNLQQITQVRVNGTACMHAAAGCRQNALLCSVFVLNILLTSPDLLTDCTMFLLPPGCHTGVVTDPERVKSCNNVVPKVVITTRFAQTDTVVVKGNMRMLTVFC